MFYDLYGETRQTRKELQVIERTTDLLEKQFGYTDPKQLSKGAFGTVIKLRRPQGENVAIKCLAPKNVREGEKKLWTKLKHPNVVSLLDAYICKKLNVVCFEMRAFPTDLMAAVQEDEYLKSPQAFQQLKIWLHQVLRGLDFLHQKHYCHLDLKPDNVLISKTSRAMIGDFTFLNQNSSKIRRKDIGLPNMYQPPETSWMLKKGQTVDGRLLDLWSFGVMSFELLTHFHIVQHFSCSLMGTDFRYASMRKALQEENFSNKMRTALPAVALSHVDIQMALKFVHSFLKTDPTSRLTADQGMQHEFLEKEDAGNSHVDKLWKDPDATIQSILGVDVSKHQARASKRGRFVRKWLQRRCSSLRKLFTCCLPCSK